MKQIEIEPVAQLSVADDSPEVYDFFSRIGDIEEVGVKPKNRNGHYIIVEPTPEEVTENIDKSLARAKREVERSRAFQRASTFNMAYWILQLEQIRTATRARNVSLYSVNKEKDQLEPKYWFGDWSDDEAPRIFKRGHGICGKALEIEKIYISEGNVQKDPHFDPSGNPRSKRVRSVLAVPIFDFANHIIGVLNLDSNLENRFSPRLRSRIEMLQPKAYDMLRELGLSESMNDDELFSSFFWIFQKAINQDYVIEAERTASPTQKPSNGVVYTTAMRRKEKQSPGVEAKYVDEVFSAIRDELSPGEGKPGPSPVRLDRLWSVFQGRENEPIPLDDFEQAFVDSVDPRKSAASAVSWLNNTLRRWGYDLEIETAHCTTYQLKLRPDSSKNRE